MRNSPALLLATVLLISCAGTGKKILEENPCRELGIIQMRTAADLREEAARYVSYKATIEEKRFSYGLLKCSYQKDPSSNETAIQLSRIAFYLAQEEDKRQDRIACAETGMAASLKPYKKGDDPRAAFYYGSNLGFVLRQKGLTALPRLPDIITALKVSLEDPSIERGGPYRALGMIYLKAPLPHGDFDRAMELLEKAAKEYPGHPQNLYFYAEVLMMDGLDDEARKYLVKAENALKNGIWGEYYISQWGREIERLQRRLSY
jgi:tetratricopeptide (TPR) repeat protein